jgi:hypothetical protein
MLQMNDSESIKKHIPGTDTDTDTDFRTLRKEGIRLAQELSGELWTDYNLHDPGVTILEQLCYALTDLMYRTEFGMADFLTGQDGGIDFTHQALYPPEQIFPCQAITTNDYRKVIFDSIPEIDNAWVEPANSEHLDGLYNIRIRPKDGPAISQESTGKNGGILDRVRAVYCRNRNLCEDVAEIRALRSEPYALYAAIEISPRRYPADILADIYFKVARHLAPGIGFHRFDDLVKAGMSLEEIFTGPLTSHGFIKEDELTSSRRLIKLSEIMRIITSIDGVKSIGHLYFKKQETIFYDCIEASGQDVVVCLEMPESKADMHVTLYKNGRKHKVDVKEVRERFDKLYFEHRALRHTPQDIAGLYRLPKGTFRDLASYYSIQSQFPDMYGINRFGIPDSEPPKRKAQARQLKAYLLIFEQIMANFLAQLHNTSRLYSLEKELNCSYFCQWLGNDQVPGVEELYHRNGTKPETAVEEILKKYDNFEDRRNRILDYLLALYGERFSQSSLRHFNYYFTAGEVDRELIKNKIAFLTHMVELNAKRAGGFNYQEPSWNTTNVAGLKMKISILLGLPYFHNRSLTVPFTKHRLKLISDDQFTRLKEGALELQFVDLSDVEGQIVEEFDQVPYDASSEEIDHEKIAALFQEIVLMKNNVVNESFLRFGVDLTRYRLGSLTSEDNFQVVFQPYDDAQWCYLVSYGNKEKAIQSVNLLRRFLIHLNIASEGFHLVEHILLRPLGKKQHDNPAIPDDFYPFSMSVVFPSWTARFHNTKFRMLAEETVRINCPAHICPAFYWLDFEKMLQFEILYENWLTEKCTPREEDTALLDALSEKLATFLMDIAHDRA